MKRVPLKTFLVIGSKKKLFRIQAHDLRHAVDKVVRVYLKRKTETDILTDYQRSSASIRFADAKRPHSVTVMDPERLQVFRHLDQLT